ncbi:MAG: glycogen debranching protein GlgX [Propionibacteriaceae bacterium]|jgi:glycogen operon protein|nr:glycogen debranching protein GlgX [Propionibacteriaceae bacterium]
MPLGAVLSGDGVTFSLWAPRATRVELALVSPDRTQRNYDMGFDAASGVWEVSVPGVGPGQRYGYRLHGPWDPDQGERFNPAKLHLDPYARAITADVDYTGPIFDHTSADNYTLDATDSAFAVPLSVVVAPTAEVKPLANPREPAEMVIYETHLRGFTKLNPAIPEPLRGTFAGFGHSANIDYLLGLGVNTVELLPVHHFISEPFLIGRGLVDYWGYNTLGFFAPHAGYSSSGELGQQVAEFKEMMNSLHAAGISVILDVVYNHTGEGGHQGPTLCFRGIDHGAYYRLTNNNRDDYDVTGTGNSVDTSKPQVMQLVLDSLRYWAGQMGVDGFRFDLASTLIRDAKHGIDQNHRIKQYIAADPLLKTRLMIAEPWDVGPYGYQVGRWGVGWSEWNDVYRNFARDFWRGDSNNVQELATRLSGSSDLFDHGGRCGTSSVNYVNCHDGFTLRDLVTYNLKHNEANGEQNHDGSGDNRSNNHGYEGETDNPDIIAARQRTAMNMMATLLLSAGMPMFCAGDELGRTQRGNNNAYCQDNVLSWVDWSEESAWEPLRGLTRELLAIRAAHPLLRPADFRLATAVLDADGKDTGRVRVAWFNEFGAIMEEGQWHEGLRRTLAMYLSDEDEALLAIVHGGHEPISFQLPKAPWANSWELLVHTGCPGELPDAVPADAPLEVPAWTVLLLKGTVK